MNDPTQLYQAILSGDCKAAEKSAREVLSTETAAAELLTVAVIPAMREMRRRFQDHECFVPEMLTTCRAMRAAMSHIRPRMAADGVDPIARVSVISLSYQPEELTGRLVADNLEGAGFDVTSSTLAVTAAERAGR